MQRYFPLKPPLEQDLPGNIFDIDDLISFLVDCQGELQ